jgi:ribonucleoside-diphosphate reductase alpha chain
MLREIIKRDGTTESFDASKINHWAMWASEDLKDRIDWSSIVLDSVKELSGTVTSQELQQKLISKCLETKSWPYILMAGKLYSILYRKELYGDNTPSFNQLFSRMVKLGVAVPLDYKQSEMDVIEHYLDHSRDFSLAHFQIEQIRYKYALTNKIDGTEFETPQFTYMRMSAALGNDEPEETRVDDVIAWYDHFSHNRINPPTPNYTNLGTASNGYASCCLYSSNDSARSLSIGDHIVYVMTYMSAGIGGILNTRTVNDPIRKGAIKHKGKYNYYKSVAGNVKANMQGGRGGACTHYIPCYDPEILSILMYQNTKTVAKKQNRDIHFSLEFNRFIGEKAARNEDVFLFTTFSAPDLYAAFFSSDYDNFVALYNKYEKDTTFKKEYQSARKILTTSGQQSEEVATLYSFQIDEANRHTSFKETIRTSNLCLEITSPTEAYESMLDLYSDCYVGHIEYIDGMGATKQYPSRSRLACSTNGVHVTKYAYELETGDYVFGEENSPLLDIPTTVEQITFRTTQPEVALCSIAGIVISNVESDEQYESACYYALKMIDKCIHKSHYELPHIGWTAKNRLNAGVGIVGLAHYLAKRGLNYTSQESLDEIHRVAERHAYFVIKASLRLGKELGNAPWINRTKWPDGWLPIDTYKRSVDTITNTCYRYPWEQLRQDIIANGGIRNSSLIAHMPTESSSKASGMPNGVYPVRDVMLKKLDGSNSIDWYAPDADILEYQSAWDLSFEQMAKVYAIIQKFTDQSISADYYRNRVKNPTVTTEELLNEYLIMIRYGIKSKYYQNPYTVATSGLEEQPTANTQIEVNARIECVGGGCQL